MNKIINWIKENKLITGIISGVIIEIVSTCIISMLKKIDFIKATKLFWNAMIKIFGGILNFKIPVWCIIVIILLIHIILLIIIRFEENKSINNSWYKSYIKDNYKGVLYSWDYYKRFDDKIDLDNFRPICRLCSGDLTTTDKYKNIHYMTSQLYCPNCDQILKTPSSEEIIQAKLFVKNNLKKKFENEVQNNIK